MAGVKEEGLAVPRSRLGRMARFGGLASGIAGNMLAEGARTVARGEKVTLSDLALTPKNASRLADQLSRLRGAAMKVGQMMSMDGNDMLPPEFADVLARLREGAYQMPPKQLRGVLNTAWGQGWLRQFAHFNVQPIAAASIGQVHRAKTKDGRDVAIKVQYPGIRESIDSDVDNVSALIKMTGVLPKGTNISPLLTEAKQQLHDEADYLREGDYLSHFRDLLAEDDQFALPALYPDLTTMDVLVMSFMQGVPIETLETADQTTRDQIMESLMRLLARELFEFRLMQTDPNFANYRYDQETGKIVLLDFGATRAIPDDLSEGYRKITLAALEKDTETMRELIISMGFLDEEMFAEYKHLIFDILELVVTPYRQEGAYDFGESDLALRLRDVGLEFRRQDKFAHVPPMDMLFIHRKIGGIYLLARRLRAKVDVNAVIGPYLRAAG